VCLQQSIYRAIGMLDAGSAFAISAAPRCVDANGTAGVSCVGHRRIDEWLRRIETLQEGAQGSC